MTGKRHGLALVIAFSVLLVMLSSMFYIATESGHDCAGENCPICQHIEVCRNTLRQISGAVAAASISAVAICFVLGLISVIECVQSHTTLVSLKVKLSN